MDDRSYRSPKMQAQKSMMQNDRKKTNNILYLLSYHYFFGYTSTTNSSSRINSYLSFDAKKIQYTCNYTRDPPIRNAAQSHSYQSDVEAPLRISKDAQFHKLDVIVQSLVHLNKHRMKSTTLKDRCSL